ncbi:MAG: aspartate-alanine antiporter [Muribaculaceae bacterium]|nr:aspartate-alanine antiporter [Muribaculaceae bacterium]MDE6753285.1 aspartate-alanine antiporter [Muribaculaceae bacterium]
MEWLFQLLRDNTVVPIFLTLGVGFWLGNLKFKSFSLGPVTATLLVGVLIGQIGIEISEPVKSVFFMLFLFSIGYSVGPQFFRSLKGDGLKQIGFAVVEGLICVSVCIVVSKIMGYNTGTAIGIFAGSQTISAVIGVGGDTLRSLGMPQDKTNYLIGMIPSAYAVCYVFGTIGTAWVVANLGPRLLGGLKKVKEETAAIEAELDMGEFTPEAGMIPANRPVSFRSYKAESSFFRIPKRVDEIERRMKEKGVRLFVERLRINGEIVEPAPDVLVRRGDTVVLGGRRETMVKEGDVIGPEVVDHELMSFGTENLPVTVSKKGAEGKTIGELRHFPCMRGVMLRGISRNNISLPIRSKTKLQRGDIVTLVGLPEDVANAVDEIGFSDRHTDETDMVFVGLGIAIGCLIGAITIRMGGIPISLSTSGGALIAGLFLGWLRNRRPTFGRIPQPVLWVMDNMGLNVFIAVVGLSAGPSFISGLKEVGVGLFFIGAICTSLPLIISIFIGKKIFRFSAAETLGCVAGSRNAVAALGAIQDNLESTLPAMGYTVTYAVGNFVLIFSGIVVALLV